MLYHITFDTTTGNLFIYKGTKSSPANFFFIYHIFFIFFFDSTFHIDYKYVKILPHSHLDWNPQKSFIEKLKQLNIYLSSEKVEISKSNQIKYLNQFFERSKNIEEKNGKNYF